jgi:hypothetical protein
MSWLAKPMIWPNFRAGSSFLIGRTAALWPGGTRRVIFTSSTMSPGERPFTATTTLSVG